jgi:hypothetical protein
MFAIAAAVLFILRGFGVLDDSSEIEWIPIGLALLAIHLAWPIRVDAWRR